MSTHGERAWTCGWVSDRHVHASLNLQAPCKPAGPAAPVRQCVCISASCPLAARHRCCTTDMTNLPSLWAWLRDWFWVGKRAGAGPPVSSVPLTGARQKMDGAAPLPHFVLHEAS